MLLRHMSSLTKLCYVGRLQLKVAGTSRLASKKVGLVRAWEDIGLVEYRLELPAATNTADVIHVPEHFACL